ncbi:MAG: NAD(P)/FAD-dependent oxidoreductase [Actinomycetota bacterium]
MARGSCARVLVVGAGPSGIAAAIALHDKGHEVTVVDKAVFPRDKCCGDGLTTNALRRLEELGFDPASVPDWQQCTDVEIRSPRGRTVAVPLPGEGVFAAIAPRAQLDHALVRLCRDKGVRVEEGRAFESVLVNDGSRVVAVVEGLGEIEADWIIAADGMWSPVRRSLGLSEPGYLGEWHAFRQYARNVTGTAVHTLHVWFDSDLLPGYAWSFPLPGGRANVGFGMLRRDGESMQAMREIWADLLARPHVRDALGHAAEMEDRHTAWPIPARVDKAVHSSGRVLFVGDAVCATDVMTGEGIGQALESGAAAAAAIDGGGSPTEVRARHSRELGNLFLADHRMSTVLGKMLGRVSLAETALRIVDTNSWTRRNFARWMFEDEARAVALTPRRWHRGFLGRPGAWAGASES